MKKCNSCGEEKDNSEFHLRRASPGGLAAKCKICQRAYDKARANNPDRVKARADYAKSGAGIKAGKKARKKWASKNKGKIYEITKSYRERNPNKYKAHGKIAYAIKTGDLVSMPCEVCKSTENLHAHHDDYAKPLNIRWLCSAHHSQWHAENGEGLNP